MKELVIQNILVYIQKIQKIKYTKKEIKLKLVVNKCRCPSCTIYKNSSKFKAKLNFLYFDLS